VLFLSLRGNLAVTVVDSERVEIALRFIFRLLLVLAETEADKLLTFYALQYTFP
jgi:hypothetical protein